VLLVLDSTRRRLYDKNKVIINQQNQIRALQFELEAERRKGDDRNETPEEDARLHELEGESDQRQEQLATVVEPGKPTEVITLVQNLGSRTRAKRTKRTRADE
jgi:hypothetical protein